MPLKHDQPRYAATHIAAHRLPRGVNELDRRVRQWAQAVVELLPKGTPLLEDEIYILGLYLAQQRRRNLELDAQNGQGAWRARLGRLLPFLSDGLDSPEAREVIHRLVASRLEADLERASLFFWRERDIPLVCDPVIDWRVALRYMAQALHRLATEPGVKVQNPSVHLRLRLILTAREMSIEVAARRREALSAFAAESDPGHRRRAAV